MHSTRRISLPRGGWRKAPPTTRSRPMRSTCSTANLNKSTYAAYGYTGVGYNGTSVTRLFGGTSSAIGQFNYSLSNYGSDERADGEAVRQRQGGQHHVMTVALDMSSTDAGDVKAMNALKACSSDSRFRKDPADPSSRPSCSGTRPGRRSPTISRKLRTSCRTCGWWGDGSYQNPEMLARRNVT